MEADLVLHPPASPNELAKADRQAGGSLDAGLREAWTLANGAEAWSPVFARPEFYTPFDFLSIAQALQHRTSREAIASNYAGYKPQEPRDPRIRAGWFHSGWMPFATFGGGTLLLFSDLSPSDQGHIGQVIGFVHDPDEIVFVAPSFADFLSASLEMLTDNAEEFFLDA